MDLNAYKQLLINLIPQGLAWPRQAGLKRDDLLEAEATELTRIDGRIADMLREADPREALELLPDWEKTFGLPDDCIILSSATIQERRGRLVQKINSTGGQSVGYFKTIAENLGYPVEFKEYRPFVVGMSEVGLVEKQGPASTYVYGLTALPEIRYYWAVDVLQPRVTWFTMGASELGKDPLAKIDVAADLECVLDKLKPAHTDLEFSYQGV